MKDSSHKRHIAKAFTWRFIGTLDTFLLSWIITGNPLTGLKIGLTEVLTKTLLYYLHERFWFRMKFRIIKDGSDSKRRHFVKTISWRILGTLDTIFLAWIITGSPFKGLQIGTAEVLTKMLLYYLHERVWYNLDYGLPYRNGNKT